MQVTGVIVQIIEKLRQQYIGIPMHIKIDCDGLCVGVYDRLKEIKEQRKWSTVKLYECHFGGKGAISEYSSSTAYTLNEKLRNNLKLNKYKEILVENIDKGLNKLPNYNKVTYRQIGFDLQGEEEYNSFINKHKRNKYINYGQYISSSKHYNDYEVDNNLKVEITIEGKTGKDIRGLVGVKEENEVLFERNVWFEIVKVDNNKIWLKEK